MMPVKPVIRITEGWKHEQNKRFGAVVVLILEAYTPEGELKIFHYAPTIQELPMLKRLCEVVESVDEHNKAVYNLQQEMKEYKLTGGCDGTL